MPPTIRALLLTDLVDSTRLVETLGDARAAEVFAAHDRVARDLLRLHPGREIDRTDGFLLLFESTSRAAAYAVAYHQALAKLGKELDAALSGRAGIHEAEVILRENSPADIARGAKPLEVEGLAKPVAARVMSVAIGGQTLMTAEAREALGKTTMRVQSHGHWRMKGVAEPMELFEVGDDASPWQPPPDGAKVYRVVADGDIWKPARDIRHGLPRERDAFVGRGEDLAALARLIEDGAAVVTVLGPAGTGKTRLARRFGWTWLGDYPGGAWFCDLSESRSIDGICGALAQAIDVPLGKDDPVVQLGHAIAGRGRCLIVLDNFEQVSEHAAGTLGRWIDRAKEAVFVVTSRERLHLPGEHVLALEPLATDPAVALFELRAREQDASFAVTDGNLADVTAIVTTLDGLPLAIELAAARIRVLHPAELRERLKERFKVLAGARGVAKRQATLLAAIDWSWDLLAAWEKAAVAQCSAFAGGFTLDAAESVLCLSPWPDAPPALDVVQALVDKSLLRVQAGRHDIEEAYFGMYVSIHEYAATKLRTEGAFAGSGSHAEQAAWTRHGEFFAKLGTEEAIEALERHEDIETRRRLALELENVVTACRRAIGRGDGATAVATQAAAWEVLTLRGPVGSAVDLCRAVMMHVALEPAHHARALQSLGRALHLSGRMEEAGEHLEAALTIHRELRNRRSEGLVLGNLGGLHLARGRMADAHAHYETALAIHREVGNRTAEGVVVGNLGSLHANHGRMDEAWAHYETALAIARDMGNRRFEAAALTNLGSLRWKQGRLEEARDHCEAALALFRELGNRRSEGLVLGNLGILNREQGRIEGARTCYEAALAVAREVGDRGNEGLVLGNLGNLDVTIGRLDEARVHLDGGLAIHREVGDRRNEGIRLTNLGYLHECQGRMDEARAHYEAALAVHREVGNRRTEGVVLGSLGFHYHEQGRLEEAHACLQQGEAILRDLAAHVELARLLCNRVRCDQRAGDIGAARATLAEAESLVAATDSGADLDLCNDLAQARAELDGASP